jgi:hypothetical protein
MTPELTKQSPLGKYLKHEEPHRFRKPLARRA